MVNHIKYSVPVLVVYTMPLYCAGIVPAHYERIHIQIYIVDQQSASQPITRAGCGTLLIGGGEEECQGNGAAKNRSAVALCVCVSVYVCVCVSVYVCVYTDGCGVRPAP